MTKSLTSGSPAGLIIRFTLPLLAGNIFQQLYLMADTLIVGRSLGVDALAAVGCTGSLTFCIIGFTFGLTAGLAIPVAQRFGAGDEPGVRRSFTHGAMISVAVAIVLSAIATPLTRAMLAALQTPKEILDGATSFAIVLFAGMIVTVLFNFVCSSMRALGNAKTPFILFAGTMCLNVALLVLFIPQLHFGVWAASFATILSQAIFTIIGFAYIRVRVPILRVSRADWRPDRETFSRLAKQGFPMALQMSIIAIGSIALQTALNRLGTTAVAGYSAALRVDQLAVAPFQSLGVTMSTFAAQNFGARAYKRVRQGVVQCVLIATGFALAIGAVNIIFGPQLISAFIAGSSPEVVELGHIYLVVNGVCYVVLGALFVLRTALQGLGNSLVPTIAGFGELIARVIGAFVLAQLLGFLGVCLANPLAWIASLVPLAIAWYSKRRWLIDAEQAAAEAAPAQLTQDGAAGEAAGAGAGEAEADAAPSPTGEEPPHTPGESSPEREPVPANA